jgi:hypothetical protein
MLSLLLLDAAFVAALLAAFQWAGRLRVFGILFP